MRDQTRYRLMVLTSLTVSLGVLAFLIVLLVTDSFGTEEMVMMLTIAAVLILLPVLLMLRTRKVVEEGFPLNDERGMEIKKKAGYHAYMVMIYVVLGFMYYDFLLVDAFGAPSLEPSGYFILLEIVAIGLFGALYLWFDRAGETV